MGHMSPSPTSDVGTICIAIGFNDPLLESRRNFLIRSAASVTRAMACRFGRIVGIFVVHVVFACSWVVTVTVDLFEYQRSKVVFVMARDLSVRALRNLKSKLFLG